MPVEIGDIVVIGDDENEEPIFAKVVDAPDLETANSPTHFRAKCFTEDKWVGPIRDTYAEARNDRYAHAQPSGHTTGVMLV